MFFFGGGGNLFFLIMILRRLEHIKSGMHDLPENLLNINGEVVVLLEVGDRERRPLGYRHHRRHVQARDGLGHLCTCAGGRVTRRAGSAERGLGFIVARLCRSRSPCNAGYGRTAPAAPRLRSCRCIARARARRATARAVI